MTIALHFRCHDSGSVVAAHYRLKDGSWRVYPYGVTMRPLVLGDISSASVVHVFESQWDAFAVADKLALHEKEDVVLIVTRGASNGALISGLTPSTATVFAWKQSDEVKNGKRAGNEWLKAVTGGAGLANSIWSLTFCTVALRASICFCCCANFA
jgi:hypothetical protein